MINIYAHRGFTNSGKFTENSINSLKLAYDFKFAGIEFDIWYLNSKLIICHDKPETEKIDSLPQIADFFIYKNNLKYWLDFKNLDLTNIDQILSSLSQIITKEQISYHNLYFVPYVTNYDLLPKIIAKFNEFFSFKANYVVVCDKLNGYEDQFLLKKLIIENNIKYLSIDHNLINKNLVDFLPKLDFFAWTVNDVKIIKKLQNLGIKNFTSDNITPKIYETHAKQPPK